MKIVLLCVFLTFSTIAVAQEEIRYPYCYVTDSSALEIVLSAAPGQTLLPDTLNNYDWRGQITCEAIVGDSCRIEQLIVRNYGVHPAYRAYLEALFSSGIMAAYVKQWQLRFIYEGNTYNCASDAPQMLRPAMSRFPLVLRK